MGVDVRCVKTGNSMTLGASGFMRWRMKIAELYNAEWYEHYKTLMEAPIWVTQEWYDAFDKKTLELLNEKKLDIKIVDFCLQSDVEGSINYGACKNILKAIGDYTDDRVYTYIASSNHDWDRLKSILSDCVATKSKLKWS